MPPHILNKQDSNCVIFTVERDSLLLNFITKSIKSHLGPKVKNNLKG